MRHPLALVVDAAQTAVKEQQATIAQLRLRVEAVLPQMESDYKRERLVGEVNTLQKQAETIEQAVEAVETACMTAQAVADEPQVVPRPQVVPPPPHARKPVTRHREPATPKVGRKK